MAGGPAFQQRLGNVSLILLSQQEGGDRQARAVVIPLRLQPCGSRFWILLRALSFTPSRAWYRCLVLHRAFALCDVLLFPRRQRQKGPLSPGLCGWCFSILSHISSPLFVFLLAHFFCPAPRCTLRRAPSLLVAAPSRFSPQPARTHPLPSVPFTLSCFWCCASRRSVSSWWYASRLQIQASVHRAVNRSKQERLSSAVLFPFHSATLFSLPSSLHLQSLDQSRL